jgi:tight adherence protein C
MTTMQVLMLVLIFAGVSGLSAALMGLFTPDPVRERLQQATGTGELQPEAEEGHWRAMVVAALAPAGRLSLPEDGWQDSPLRQRFVQAGLRSDQAPLVFYGAKTLLTFALPLIFMLAMGISSVSIAFNAALVAIVALAGAGYYLPNLWLRRRLAARQLEVFEGMPDAIDLMTIMAEAGLGLDAAIARVADEIGMKSVAVAEEFRLVGLELRAGASREQALRNLASRTGVEEVELFVAMLVQTDRFGTSMAESLRMHSDDLRTKRRLRAEEAAAKLSVKLLFPIIFFIFPSILIVLLGPAGISIFRAFAQLAAAR